MPVASRQQRFFWVLLGFFLLLVLGFFLNICIGSVAVPVREVFAILGDPQRNLTETAVAVVWQIRLPRTVAVMLLGGALALSGFLLQTFFQNPIAGPYILGISSGSKLTVSLLMVGMLGAGYQMTASGLVATAFLGAMLAMGFVLLLAQRVPRASMLVVGGVMIGYICSALTDFVVTFADDASIVDLHNWSRGSFNGLSWSEVSMMAWVVLFSCLFVGLLAKPLGAYQLGEAYAQSLGVPIRAVRVALVLLSSILSACVTAFAGPISFVGVAVPHIVKALVKTAKAPYVLPLCFLGGAIFCLFCDLIARTVFAPVELGIGSVTALFGAPIVLSILTKKTRRA